MSYPSVDEVLAAWLPEVVDGVRTWTTDDLLPTSLTYLLPLVQIVTYSGADHTVGIDDASVDVDVYAPTRVVALEVAEQIRVVVRTQLVGVVGGVTVSYTRTVQRPTSRPYDNTSIRRVGASYMIRTHAVV